MSLPMKGERGKMIFPIRYKERRGKRGWYAQQTDNFTGMVRKSAVRYESREDLVAGMAFGKHQWGRWEDGKR